MEFWRNLFDVSDFPARWSCGRWTDAHGWLHILSDLAVATAYFSIPCVLAYFIFRRKDLPFRKIFLLFAAFILLCGSTHLMEAAIFWWPAYRFGGLLKLLTAAVSWGTVFALIPAVPRALQMRSPEELEQEIMARKAAEDKLARANAELERRVEEGLLHLREANAAVAAEREWLSVTLSSIGDAVITTDIAGRVLSLNPIAERLTGWVEADAKGVALTEVFRIVNERSRSEVENPALRALAQGTIIGLANHTILIAKDGVERFIDDSAAPIRNGAGELIGAVLIFRDITARYRAEQELQDQHELNRAITDNAATAIFLVNDQGRCTFMNPAAEQMTGFSYEEVRGKVLHGVIHHTRPDGSPYPLSECPLNGALAEHLEVHDHEDLFIRKNGEFFPVSSNARPIHKNGVGVATVIEVRDLTQQKASAKALVESNERFTQLADSISQLVWTAQPDGHIDWYNQRWYHYTGTTFEEMQGWGWSTVHDPEFLPTVVERWKICLETGTPLEIEFPLRGSDGRYRPFLTKALPYRDQQGAIVRWFGTNTDISEQKQAQEELRRVASELAEADRRKDEFLAMLAHELRNPLAPIRSGLEWMRSAEYDAVTFEKVRDVMARQTHQLVLLVDDLLDVSRITLGTLKLNRQRVAVSDIVQSAIEECQVLIREAGHDLRLDIPSEPIYLYADSSRLTQAVSNLLNNAARYTPPGGTIWMSAVVEEGELRFVVKDTGVGIPADMLESIFEMFSRIGGSTQRDPGLGIGLTLVRRLVEMHGGRVEAQSQGIDQGSTFTIRLPLREPGEEQPAEQQHPRPAGRLRLLIVDDNRAAAEMLGMVLAARGHEIRVGFDGRQAVALAEEFGPDVVLMDLGMPVMSGDEAARQIRRQPWGSEMILVALSGWGQDEDKRRSRDAGFDSHLVKPVETAELERILATLRKRPA